MKILGILFFFLPFLIPVLGNAQSPSISGGVIDGKDRQPLTGVIVRLNPIGDSANMQVALSDVDGLFRFDNLRSGTYQIRATYIGYEVLDKNISLQNENLILDTFRMLSGSSSLQGVTVTAEQIRAQQLGDTTQFNANAFKTNPDATAEDLLAKIPGITSQNGTVTVNGEKVKKILVDGKEFFGDDPTAAIQNLPAEIIDKIQIFDKASDQAEFTGFDDGNNSKTINIITKKGKNNGYFGKLTAGAGLEPDEKTGRYTSGGNINYFNGDRRISLVGLANNVNQQNFSSDDLLGVSAGSSGGRRRGRSGGSSSDFLVGATPGVASTQSVGLNYSNQLTKNAKVTLSYFFNRSDNQNNSFLTRNYITDNADSALQYTENSLQRAVNENHRIAGRLEWALDSNNTLVISPRFSYQEKNSNRSLQGITTIAEGGDQSNINTTNQNKTFGYKFSNQLTFRHKFAKRGRTLSFNANTGLNSRDGNGLLYSQNKYGLADTQLTNQNFNTGTNGMNLSGNLSYTEPLTQSSQLMVNYSPSYNRGLSKRNTFDETGQNLQVLDSNLSNDYTNNYYYQKAGVGYRYQNGKVNFNATLNAQSATLDSKQNFPRNTDLTRSFNDLLPQASLNYKFSKTENLRLFYRTQTDAPGIFQLQPLVDNSNPLLLQTGNADLRQDYTHSINARYGNTNTKTGVGIFVFANGSFVNNYIGSNTFIANRDTLIGNTFLNQGAQLTSPVNLDGNYALRSFFTYAQPLKSLKSNLNLNVSVNYNRIPAIINNLNNFANNYTLGGGFVASSNISENVDFTFGSTGTYNIVRNTLQKQTDNNYYQQKSSLKVNVILDKSWVANTSVNHLYFSGLGSAFDNQYVLWNASLGYKFLKDKSMQASLYVFDILKQNKAIARNVTESYIEDSQTEVLQRYMMLQLTYTLRAFKNKASEDALDTEQKQNNAERGGGMGMGGRRRAE